MKFDIQIPESINDITLKQYQRFFAIYDKNSDEDFINRKSLEIFYGIEGKHYDLLKVKDIDKIVSVLNDALMQKIKLITTFELNGIDYGFIPNLDDVTFGEFVDMDENSGIDKLHLLMSILYRPIVNSYGERYNIAPYNGTNSKLEDMPLGIALSALDFFFDIALQLTSATLKYLNPKDKQQREKLTLAKNGLGILQSTPYRMGILQSSAK